REDDRVYDDEVAGVLRPRLPPRVGVLSPVDGYRRGGADGEIGKRDEEDGMHHASAAGLVVGVDPHSRGHPASRRHSSVVSSPPPSAVPAGWRQNGQGSTCPSVST